MFIMLDRVFPNLLMTLVMCRLGLEALSRPKPAFKSLAEPRPRTGLQRAGGSGFKF